MPGFDYIEKVPPPTSLERQPQELDWILRYLVATQRSLRLYQHEHPNAVAALDKLMSDLNSFLAPIEQATLVFTRDAIILNDDFYAASRQSRAYFSRLRARGVMAVTFIYPVSRSELGEFLVFLEEKPRDIRLQGGARDYLRRRRVSHIVAIEAVYANDEAANQSSQQIDALSSSVGSIDAVIGAAIDWLSRQDDEEDEEHFPRLPIEAILSDPEMAARLIREAVTKIHASRPGSTNQELAGEVVHGLKNLAAPETEQWDQAVPKIRSAISKLPRDVRPSLSGFSMDDCTQSIQPQDLSISEVEARVQEDVARSKDSSSEAQPITSEDLSGYFGIAAQGLLSTWSAELKPSSILRACGSTHETLMVWETTASEHGRIARAQAALVKRAIDIDDIDTALVLIETLLNEVARDDHSAWRSLSARSALESVGTTTMANMIRRILKTGGYHEKEIAAQLVETLPDLAMNLMHTLGVYRNERFDEALKCGLIKCGSVAVLPLVTMVHGDLPMPRLSALEALVSMGTASAIKQVADFAIADDVELAIKALSLLPASRSQHAIMPCISALSSRSSEVVCQALHTMEEIGDPAAIPHVSRIAADKGLGVPERVVAIKCLGELGGYSEIDLLERISNYRPLFGRKRQQEIRAAAESAAQRIQSRLGRASAA